MSTVRIRERRLSLRSREVALLGGTPACSGLFLVTQNQVGLLGYAVAPILLLGFFVLQADLAWRGHRTARAAFTIAAAAWLTFSILATYAFSGLGRTPIFVDTWLKALLGAGLFAALFSLSVLLARKRSVNLYWYLAGSLAVAIAAAAIHPGNSGKIEVRCERGSCATGAIAFWPGAFQASDGKRPVSVVLPKSDGDWR
ncbi:hypothetical protein [Xanthomonas fragariae]|uniref:hypothetical protein n=1 Tax=Xanthomonas fragariae TaxID=48664 RepID=UPI001ABEA5FB|nr:hypothetical protein [Xanthomonas fragariae]